MFDENTSLSSSSSYNSDEPEVVIKQIREPEAVKNASLKHLVIVPCLLTYFFAMGILWYALPEYTQNYVKQAIVKRSETGNTSSNRTFHHFNPCNVSKSAPGYETYTEIQQTTAEWNIYFSVSSSIPMLFANLIWGSYSDILGRRFLFVLCTLGASIKVGIFIVVVRSEASLLYIVLANVIEGLTGSFTIMFVAAFSFVADITEPGRKRTIYIVVVECCLGITVTLSTFVTGYFIQYQGFFYPVLTSCLLCVFSMVTFLLFLPETLRKHPDSKPEAGRLLNYIKTAFRFYFKQESKVKRWKYILLILSLTFIAIPAMNRGSIETLYQLGRPFCWTATKIGWFGAMKTGLASLLGMSGVFILQKFIADDTIALIGTLSVLFSLVLEGMATTNFVMYIVTVVASFAYTPNPMIRSLMSVLTPANQQGALFASIGVIETLSTLIGAISNNVVYSLTMSIFNGFVFMLLAACSALSTLFILIFMYVQRKHGNQHLDFTVNIPDVVAIDDQESTFHKETYDKIDRK